MLKTVERLFKLAATAAVFVTMTGTAEAGPPLICHPFDTGSTAMLPWGPGPGWNTPDRSDDLQKLTADTLRLLTPSTPVLARMETMRRATIYASQDVKVADALLKAVLDRARATPKDSRDPMPWFDAGYLIDGTGRCGTRRSVGTCWRAPSCCGQTSATTAPLLKATAWCGRRFRWRVRMRRWSSRRF